MKFTIKIQATLNGKTCKNPQIEWIQGEDFIYPCEIDTTKGEIVVELKPDASPNACIEGFIKCEDECLNCPPQYFKKCLCTDVTVLTECQICVDGFIVEICTPEELAAGKICTPNGCLCPPEKPILDPNTGQCVECISGTKSGCKICVAGQWQDIECGDNARCVGGECVCLPGYVRNVYTGQCDPAPQCIDDSDCGPCQTCVNGRCEPIICPPNHICVNGECIYWPCSNTNCQNGADCGKDCGCLNGECVPCYILQCTGECQNALGCECINNTCVSSDKCTQSCDGFNPCTQPGCTCYNNECVDCSNFPCDPDDCTSRDNCGCVDGNCDGDGNGCTDTFELIKEEDCSNPKGCKLKAELTTKSSCGCDPVIFKTRSSRGCNITLTNDDLIDTNPAANAPGNVIMEIQVGAYKKVNNVDIQYSKYLQNLSFGDNELLSGQIGVRIEHYYKNQYGQLTPYNPNTLSLSSLVFTDNKLPIIRLTDAHIQKSHSSGSGTFVIVTVFTQSVAIQSNGCTRYGGQDIATYTLDYTTTAAETNTCNKINTTYRQIQEKSLVDNISEKTPLFVWSKSTTGVFANTEFNNASGTYTQSGWFRKRYGVKVGTKWVDFIDNPSDYANGTNEHGELWNNYNYRVKTDCGCATVATREKVIFCCPKDIPYTIDTCGRRIVIPPFNTCDVNKKLPANSSTYKIPLEAQTYYQMVLNGDTVVDLRTEGGNLITQFEYTHTVAITSIVFKQVWKGSPLVSEGCEIVKSENPQLPQLNPVVECEPIARIVINKSQHPTLVNVNIQRITPTPIPIPIQNTTNAYISNCNLGPLTQGCARGTYLITALFANNCVVQKTVDLNCQPKVDAEPTPSPYLKAECNPQGQNPVIVATPTNFGSGVQYSIDGINFQTSNIFPVSQAGTYTITAREVVGETTLTATDTVEILNPVVPTMTFSPSSLCGNQGSTLTITGAPGSVYTFTTTSTTPIPSQITIGNNGTFMQSIPASGQGTYSVQLLTDASGATCLPASASATISAVGQTVSPTIVLDGISCIGQVRNFRINDGGLNRTYTVVATNGYFNANSSLSQIQLQATGGGFNAQFYATSVSSVLQIVSVDNPCDILIPHTANVTSSEGPMIESTSNVCDNLSDSYIVDIIVSGTVTDVVLYMGINFTQGSFAASNISGNLWRVTVPKTHQAYRVIATNSVTGCSDTTGRIDFTPCNQPRGEFLINANSPTCGIQNTQVYYENEGDSDIGFLPGSTYQWYEVIGGNDVIITGASGTIFTTIPPLTVTSQIAPTHYRLKITKPNGNVYQSNVTSVVAQNNLTPVITGLSSVNTSQIVSYSASPVISGATYQWTLTNSQVTNQTIGTNSSNLSNIQFTVGGINTLTVTINDGVCVASETFNVTVTSACSHSVTVNSANSCSQQITAVVSPNPNTATVTEWTWTATGMTTQSGFTSTPTLDLTTLYAGQVLNDLVLSVTFSDGCIVNRSVPTYTRCTCLCVGGSCSESNGYSAISLPPFGTNTHTLGTFDAGTEFDWALLNAGRSPARYVMKLNNTIIFDSGIVSRISALDVDCVTSGCPVGTEYLADETPGTYTLTGGTSPQGILGTISTSACPSVNNSVGIVGGFFGSNNLHNIVLASPGVVTVEVTSYSPTNCGGVFGDTIFFVRCV